MSVSHSLRNGSGKHRLSTIRKRLAAFPAVSFPVPYVVLVALVLLVASQRGSYLSLTELNLATSQTLALVLVATSQTIVMLAGGIDLSVGGVISFTTCVAATQVHSNTESMVMWTVILLVAGAVIGAVNGVLVAVLNLQPFIATLATWSVLDGFALLILPTPGGTVPSEWVTISNSTVGGLSTCVVAIVVLVVLWICFCKLPLGRAVKAVGSNSEAAQLAGVRVRQTVICAYALSGVFGVLAGLFLVTQTGGGSPLIGSDFILPSVAAAVIGGTRLSGGSATLAGAVAGAFILTVIGDVVFTFGIESSWSLVLSGALLLATVMGPEILRRVGREVSRVRG